MEQEAERPQLAYCAAVALSLVLDKTRGNMRMFPFFSHETLAIMVSQAARSSQRRACTAACG